MADEDRRPGIDEHRRPGVEEHRRPGADQRRRSGDQQQRRLGDDGRRGGDDRGGLHSRTAAVYVISVAAELAGVHPQTLRIYERKGLVEPRRTVGGSRRYSEHDVQLLRRIQDLTAAGLNLEGVRQVLALEQRVADLEQERDRLRAEVAEARAEVERAVERTSRRYRRDLVPLSQALELFGARPRWIDEQS